jgi:hypothetical protein
MHLRFSFHTASFPLLPEPLAQSLLILLWNNLLTLSHFDSLPFPETAQYFPSCLLFCSKPLIPHGEEGLKSPPQLPSGLAAFVSPLKWEHHENDAGASEARSEEACNVP